MLANRIGVETTISAVPVLSLSGCEKAWTSSQDDSWVNFPHIGRYLLPGSMMTMTALILHRGVWLRTQEK